jgi:basic membrane protein A
MKNRLLYIIGILLPLCALTACGDDEEHTTDAQDALRPAITVIFSPGGLGDGGYNDLIMQGVQQVYKSRSDVDITFYSPASSDEGDARFRRWWQGRTDDGQRELYILAGSDYETLAAQCATLYDPLPDGKEVLLFESDIQPSPSISTFRISMYGAAYLCGKAITLMGCSAPVVLLSNPQDQAIQVAADGFIDGYNSGASEWADPVETRFLADDWHGYTMPDSAYRATEQLMQEYDFVFGVAGGSNAGIYRYFREYPLGRNWTAGMDVDQSAYSNKVVGSLVKHIDVLIEDYLNSWADGNGLPRHRVYGLESKYEEWVVAGEYDEFFEGFVDEYQPEAIEKEDAYEEDL